MAEEETKSTDEGAEGAEANKDAPAAQDASIEIRRGARSRFLSSSAAAKSKNDAADEDDEEGAAEDSADQVVVSRVRMLDRRTGVGHQLSRQRKAAGDLPAWEPLPPGELKVTRPSGTARTAKAGS